MNCEHVCRHHCGDFQSIASSPVEFWLTTLLVVVVFGESLSSIPEGIVHDSDMGIYARYLTTADTLIREILYRNFLARQCDALHARMVDISEFLFYHGLEASFRSAGPVSRDRVPAQWFCSLGKGLVAVGL
jgi:hypothetical protein